MASINIYTHIIYEDETAVFIYPTENEIKFNNRIYTYWMNIDFPNNYEISLVIDKTSLKTSKYLILDSKFPKTFQFREYFSFFHDKIDPNNNFIKYMPNDGSVNLTYVDKNIVVPTVKNSTIEAIWFDSVGRNSSTDLDFINEIKTCITINNKQLSSNTIELINTNSVNGSDIWIKFKDYPLIAKYTITVSEGYYITLEATEGDGI